MWYEEPVLPHAGEGEGRPLGHPPRDHPVDVGLAGLRPWLVRRPGEGHLGAALGLGEATDVAAVGWNMDQKN